MNTKTPNTQYRQGDVFIERIDALPSNLKPVARSNGRVVLAHGAATGHDHAIADAHCDMLSASGGMDTNNVGGVTYIVIRDEMAALTHDEHATIMLDPGVYKITRQREYSPEAIRNVAD